MKVLATSEGEAGFIALKTKFRSLVERTPYRNIKERCDLLGSVSTRTLVFNARRTLHVSRIPIPTNDVSSSQTVL
jgi:hypothetical protein